VRRLVLRLGPRLGIIALALAALLALPDAVHACPVCFDSSDENRQAFLVTAAFLTLLPLGMVGGVGLWLRKRAREVGRDPGEAPAGPGSTDTGE
jgi:hypothetical protein